MSRFPTDADTVATLPIRVLAPAQWIRVSSADYSTPIHWAIGSQGRFTPMDGTKGTLYIAENEVGALAESICRNAVWLEPQFRFTPIDELESKGFYEIAIPTIRVLDFCVANLARYGLDAQIWTQRDYGKGYQWGPAWATKAIELGLNGICYFSRSHTTSQCLALFGDKGTILPWKLRSNLMADLSLDILDNVFDWKIV